MSKAFLSPETRRRLAIDRAGGYDVNQSNSSPVYYPVHHSNSVTSPSVSSTVSASNQLRNPLRAGDSANINAHRQSFTGASTPMREQSRHENDVDFFAAQASEYKDVSVKYREVIEILTRKVESLQQQNEKLKTVVPAPGVHTPERVLFASASPHSREKAVESAWREWELGWFAVVSTITQDACDLATRKSDLLDEGRAAISTTERSLRCLQRECLQLASELDNWSPNREW